MQGPNYLDLAKTLANEHLDHRGYDAELASKAPAEASRGIRERVGHTLISLGERLAPADVQLRVSTGPPCP